jgi:hypothetical protein
MELPKKILEDVVLRSEEFFKNYVRKQHLTKEDVIKEVSDLYNNKKKIIWLEDSNQLKGFTKNSEKPWVYHRSLNLNWVLFYNFLYEEYLFRLRNIFSEEDFTDISDIYLKTWRLNLLFDHADGLIEDGDKVFIVKDDINFIKNDLPKWKT